MKLGSERRDYHPINSFIYHSPYPKTISIILSSIKWSKNSAPNARKSEDTTSQNSKNPPVHALSENRRLSTTWFTADKCVSVDWHWQATCAGNQIRGMSSRPETVVSEVAAKDSMTLGNGWVRGKTKGGEKMVLSGMFRVSSMWMMHLHGLTGGYSRLRGCGVIVRGKGGPLPECSTSIYGKESQDWPRVSCPYWSIGIRWGD